MVVSTRPANRPPSPKALFQRRLLAWFRRSARDLPWRRTRDAYRVLVSEFMLQQTQVSRVLEYYPRFLARFPSVAALAHARPRAVREAWDGLGYYARARNLHALAKRVSGTGGQVPDDPMELQTLPGVGRYTAGAVACFAYEKPVATVDTNIARVIRRVWGIRNAERATRNNGATSRRIWDIAAGIVPRNGKTAWKFNQAMMELGATVCVARKPKCPDCPVWPDCKTGRRSGRRRAAEPPRGS